MKRLGLKITVESPLLLTKGPAAHNLVESLDFIPGNTVRGLLAQHFLDLGGTPDAEFHKLFVNGLARFGFARINGAHPIPLSARTCKYHGGFAPDGHGVVDILLGSGKEIRCSCGQPVDYFEGFYTPERYKKEGVKTRLITRTAMDPKRGSASAGRLYSQRLLEEGQVFISTIEVPDELAAIMHRLLGAPFTAGIGKGRSRGQGWVRVEECDPSPPLVNTAAATRAPSFIAAEGEQLLAVTLLSDALFRDDYLRDQTGPDFKHLQVPGLKAADWETDKGFLWAFAATRIVFGFDGRPLLLPRPPRLAVVAGSVFLFRAKKGVTPTLPPGDGLTWVGEKNQEGYGQAVLWHPFHLQPDTEVLTCTII